MREVNDPTLAAILANILDHPGDDTARGAYADRCDDLGLHDLAEFMRIQCELARPEPTKPRRPSVTVSVLTMAVPVIGLTLAERRGVRYKRDLNEWSEAVAERDRMRRREHELIETFCGDDLAVEFGLPNHEAMYPIASGVIVPGLDVELYFCRGLVEFVKSSPSTWLTHGHAIHRSNPTLHIVTLSSNPGSDFHGSTFALDPGTELYTHPAWPGIFFGGPINVCDRCDGRPAELTAHRDWWTSLPAEMLCHDCLLQAGMEEAARDM